MLMPNFKTTLCFTLIICVFCGVLPMQAGIEGPGAPSGGSASASTHPIKVSSSSTVTVSVGGVYIDKFTDKLEYNKSESIKVTMRIYTPKNSKLVSDSFKDVYLYEELNPRQTYLYEVVNSTPDYYDYDLESGELIWHFDTLTDLIKLEYIEYTIKTDIRGYHTLGNTRIEKEDEVIYSLSRPELIVVNHPPVIENVTFPSTPIWCGDINYIKATVKDPDNDTFTCDLYYNGFELTPVNKTTFIDAYNYTWNLHKCNPGTYQFYIKTYDGIETNETKVTEIVLRKKMFGVLPYPEEYKLPVITGVVAGLILSGILGIIKGSTRVFNKNNVKSNDESPEESTNGSDE